jgi:hypothetical protein
MLKIDFGVSMSMWAVTAYALYSREKNGEGVFLHCHQMYKMYYCSEVAAILIRIQNGRGIIISNKCEEEYCVYISACRTKQTAQQETVSKI